MPTSERRAGKKLSQSDLFENKLSYSQQPRRKLSRSLISQRFFAKKN